MDLASAFKHFFEGIKGGRNRTGRKTRLWTDDKSKRFRAGGTTGSSRNNLDVHVCIQER